MNSKWVEEIIMGYVFLAISLLCGATKGYCGKRTSGHTERITDAVYANLLRMLLCIVIGFFVVLFSGKQPALGVDAKTLAICLFSGLSTSVMAVSWLLAVKKGAYMLVDVFGMLGFTVPIVGSVVCFGEHVKPTQIFAMVLLIGATLVLCSYNNSIKAKLTLPAFFTLLLLCLSNGGIDFSQKLFTVYAPNVPTAVFNFYTYIFAFVFLIICLPFFKTPREAGGASAIHVLQPIFGYIGVMAICLFLHSFTKTLAAHYLPSAVLYPLANGCALMLSTGMAVLFFGEKLTVKCLCGVGLAFLGILAVNL